MNIFGIPYRRLTIKSSLRPIQVEACLKRLVWNHPVYWLKRQGSPGDKQFVGLFSRDDFRLQRLYGFLPISKSIFKPTFYGTIESELGGSEIKIIITLDPIEMSVTVGILLLFVYGVIAERNIYLLIFVVVFNLLQYLMSFAPDVRFFEKHLLPEFRPISSSYE